VLHDTKALGHFAKIPEGFQTGFMLDFPTCTNSTKQRLCQSIPFPVSFHHPERASEK
jgi:hypothetical protein